MVKRAAGPATPKPTQRMIAERCGLKQTAVSYALQGDTRHVSPETIAQVRAVAEELGYSANQAARRMAAARHGTPVITRLIAVCLPPGFQQEPYFLAPFLGVLDALTAAHFDLLVLNKDADLADDYFATSPAMARGDVDALIVFAIERQLARLRAQARALPAFGERPFVALIHPMTGCSNVRYDDAGGAYALGCHLLSLGHRHLLALVMPYGPGIWRQREAGLRRAYAEHGLDLDAYLHRRNITAEWIQPSPDPAKPLALYQGEWWEEATATTLPDFLRAHPAVTGIVAWNDVSARHAWRLVTASGRRVPEEISITGFDDLAPSPAAEAHQPLTTIHLPAHSLGQEAAQLAIARVTGELADDQERCLAGELVIRASTAPASPTRHP